MRFCWWIGHSGTSAMIAEQFGLAMMPLWSPMRLALISGITSGTFGSMRKAEELSTTTAPAFTAAGANFREMSPPAENSAMSTPSKDFSVSSSITILSPRKSMVLPAERALASALSLPSGKSAPVHGGDEFGADRAGYADNGNNGLVAHGPILLVRASMLRAIKKAPVLFRRGFGSDNAIVRLRAHGSRAPGGCFGFRGRFGRSRHDADLC